MKTTNQKLALISLIPLGLITCSGDSGDDQDSVSMYQHILRSCNSYNTMPSSMRILEEKGVSLSESKCALTPNNTNLLDCSSLYNPDDTGSAYIDFILDDGGEIHISLLFNPSAFDSSYGGGVIATDGSHTSDFSAEIGLPDPEPVQLTYSYYELSETAEQLIFIHKIDKEFESEAEELGLRHIDDLEGNFEDIDCPQRLTY